jgi:hypothetical protein
MKYHTTKEGRKIKLSNLELNHLKNIIRWIERKSVEGLTISIGGGTCAEDMWCDEYTIYGEKVFKKLNYYDYKAELSKR